MFIPIFQDNCKDNQVEKALENISKTKGFLITFKSYNLTKNHQHKFCLTKFSGDKRLEAISCNYLYFMEELRIIKDEIILALLPDLLEMFLNILSTNGINHLKLKILGISTVTLSKIQQEFPSMLFQLLDKRKYTYPVIEELSKSIQEMKKRYWYMN